MKLTVLSTIWQWLGTESLELKHNDEKDHGGIDTSPHKTNIKSISHDGDDDDDEEEDGGLNIWSYVVITDTCHR